MRVRAVYWLMLALALGGSIGLRWAVVHRAPDDWQPAVYRYPADGMPACADLTDDVVLLVLHQQDRLGVDRIHKDEAARSRNQNVLP